MKEKITKQIHKEIWTKIVQLENERNQKKQKSIAEEIINKLDIEDFEPYIAYDENGDKFIALNYVYNSGINEALMSGKHDVSLSSDDVYIEDEYFLKECKENSLSIMRDKVEKEDLILQEKIKSQYEDKKRENFKRYKKQKEYDEISKKLLFLNNDIMVLINFERPKCVGDYEKIVEIDGEINSLKVLINHLEEQLEELENESTND